MPRLRPRGILVPLLTNVLCLAIFFFWSTLKHYLPIAFLGDFLVWALDMLWMALASFCLIVAALFLSMLFHDIIVCFRYLCGLCVNRFVARPTLPSAVQLQADEASTEEEGTVSHWRLAKLIAHSTLSLLHRSFTIFGFGSLVYYDFRKRALDDVLKSASIQECVVIILKYILRGFAALSAMILLSLCVGSTFVHLRGRRQAREEEGALETALDKMESGQVVPQMEQV